MVSSLVTSSVVWLVGLLYSPYLFTRIPCTPPTGGHVLCLWLARTKGVSPQRYQPLVHWLNSLGENVTPAGRYFAADTVASPARFEIKQTKQKPI